MSDDLVIHVFTLDFRLKDNPSLYHALECGRVWPVLVVDHAHDPFPPGEASRWWLYQAIQDIERQLGRRISIFVGEFAEVLSQLVENFPVKGVFWNHYFDAYHLEQERKLCKALQQRGVAVRSFNGTSLWDPWSVNKDDGTHYKVFTPFYRKGCLGGPYQPRPVLAAPTRMHYVDVTTLDAGVSLRDCGILPEHTWHEKLEAHWDASENGAQQQLKTFVENGLCDYKKGRDFPAKKHVSMLSPYLHFGQISVSQVWEAIAACPQDDNTAHFHSELGWREFSYYLLYHFPTLPAQNLQAKFDRFPWQKDEVMLRKWQRGQTGIPIVDAGMRQLWQTGYMHNRLRMIVGSFLVKNMGHHWTEGEAWFRDCLVDFDLASNSASWQWVAGCGTDAAPYFRIFNPVTQGERFDPTGEFVKHYVPELADMPLRFLFNPWEAPLLVLQAAGVTLGESYPRPMLDLKQSREQALANFKTLSSSN